MKPLTFTAQEMKFSIRDFFSKHDQIHSFLWIWSHLLNKSLTENFSSVQCFEKYQSFQPQLEFSANNFISRNNTLFIF